MHSCVTRPSTPSTSPVTKSVTLVGITTAQFGPTQQTAFKTTVETNVGPVCGTDSAIRVCIASDVSLTFPRRDVAVSYTLTVASTASSTASSTLDTYTASTRFAADLSAVGVTVTSTTSAASNSDSSDNGNGVVIGVVVVGLVVVALMCYCMSKIPPLHTRNPS